MIAEVFVTFALFYGLALQITWRYAVSEHPQFLATYRILSQMLSPIFYCFIIASLFLVLASPFFLQSLRSVAVRAWIIGVGALLSAGFLGLILR